MAEQRQGWFSRTFILPFLRWLHGRVGRAVDHSDTAVAIARVEASLAKLFSEFGPVIERTSTLAHIILSRNDTIVAELRSSVAQLTSLQAAMNLRDDAMQLRVADLKTAMGGAERAILAELRALIGVGVAGGLAQSMSRPLRHLELGLQRHLKVLGEVTAVPTSAGYMLIPTSDVELLLKLAEGTGVLERGTLQVVLALLRPGSVMIDVGAGVGTLALPAAQAVGSSGRVIALEPVPEVAQLLFRSSNLNGLNGRLKVEAVAAGEADGTCMFHVSQMTSHKGQLSLAATTSLVEVPVRPLDELVPLGERVDLVKIDAKGDELRVLAGMRRITADNSDLMVIAKFGHVHLLRSGTTMEDWLTAFSGFGWQAFEIDEATGTVRPLRSAGLEHVESVNLLFARHPPSALLLRGRE